MMLWAMMIFTIFFSSHKNDTAYTDFFSVHSQAAATHDGYPVMFCSIDLLVRWCSIDFYRQIFFNIYLHRDYNIRKRHLENVKYGHPCAASFHLYAKSGCELNWKANLLFGLTYNLLDIFPFYWDRENGSRIFYNVVILILRWMAPAAAASFDWAHSTNV